MLRYAVETCGDKDWGMVAILVDNRDPYQCQKRWSQTVDPAVHLGKKFSAEEERKLFLLVCVCVCVCVCACVYVCTPAHKAVQRADARGCSHHGV